MKYTKEQRLDIAKRVYDGELTVEEAAVKYDLNPSSVKGYLRLYRAETGLPPRTRTKKAGKVTQSIETPKDSSLKEYESMSKEELIDALVMSLTTHCKGLSICISLMSRFGYILNGFPGFLYL